MKIPDEIIERVRDSVNIVDVVGRSVALKKAGANHKGLCPFHNEKTPSFNVHEGKQIYKCFGCGEGGNVFQFLVKTRNLSFPEAVRELAAEAGIEVPDQTADDPQAQARAKQRERLFELLEAASAWFRRNLQQSAEAEKARWYAVQRSLSEEIQESFQLGYAPFDGSALEKAAIKKGFSRSELIEAGLLVSNERGVYARFRGRLIFPIRDAAGRAVGFGGRVLGEGEPKYLNSPETPLFNKSDLLFALPQAKNGLLKEKRALLVEGYMDAIACHQAGAAYTVATLGTALTPTHAKQLKRYVERVYLVFDSDQAGLAAAQRGCETLLGAGLDVRVVRLGEFKDPDDFLKAKGLAAFEGLLPQALEAPAFFLEAAMRNAVRQSGAADEKALPLKAKVAAMQALFPLLAKYDTEMETGTRLREAASRVGLSDEEVLKDFMNFKRGQKPRVLAEKVTADEEYRQGRLGNIEREIIGLLSVHKDLRQALMESGQRPAFRDADMQNAADLLWKYPDKGAMEIEIVNEDNEHFVTGVRQIRSAVGASLDYENPAKALKDLLQQKKNVELRLRANELQRRISELEKDPDPEDPDAMLRALAEITAIRKEIDVYERTKKSAHVFQD